MNRPFTATILVIGGAMLLASGMFDLGPRFILVGIVLTLFASGALLWEIFRAPRSPTSKARNANR